ncbi:MAG: ABC transporter substrate-binding protein [Povalibacter sp.]
MNTHPSRIVCLSAETAETLCLLDEGDRIVGLSGPVGRLPDTQQRKPRLSVHTDTCVERICALEADLVLGSGQKHADVLASLAQRGIAVHLFSQESVLGILSMIRIVGALVGRDHAATAFASSLEWRIEAIRARSHEERRPRIYFEEWQQPSISACTWVSELIDIAGGANCFPELAARARQEERIVHDLDEVVRREPDIIIGAWNDKPFQTERVESRAGWKHVPAVVNGEVHGMDSSLFQQPGPAALTHGLDALHRIVENWRERRTRMFQTAFVPNAVKAASGAEERVA